MEIWRNFKQLNTLNQRSLTLAEKKWRKPGCDSAATAKTEKIKVGQVGSKYILVFLHTRVVWSIQPCWGDSTGGRVCWPTSPLPQSRSPMGDRKKPACPSVTRSSSPTSVIDITPFTSGCPQRWQHPGIPSPSCAASPSLHDASQAVLVSPCWLPHGWRVAATSFLPYALISKPKELKLFEPPATWPYSPGSPQRFRCRPSQEGSGLWWHCTSDLSGQTPLVPASERTTAKPAPKTSYVALKSPSLTHTTATQQPGLHFARNGDTWFSRGQKFLVG